jgi:STE24 endopeptidase
MNFEGSLTIIFLVAFALKMLTKIYLDFRNLDHIVKNRSRVPSKFANKVSLEDHQKAADYARTKTQFNRFGMIVDAFLLLFWTLGGGLEFVNQAALSLSTKPIFHGLLAIGFFSLINMVISLPQSWFSQFVIEEKFGFNKSTNKIFFTDFAKGILLSLVIGAPILATLFYIIDKLGTHWWIYGWSFFCLFQLFIVRAYPTFIAPLFNKFNPLENAELKTQIETFLKA